MIESHNKGTLLTIHVKPRSKRQAIMFERDNVCYVHVKAAPTRGKANQEVVKLIAKELSVPTHRIRILSGIKASTKILLIEGMNTHTVLTALNTE